MQKLRELNRRVIGVGLRKSTSKPLPPACDEFMFYDNLVSDDEPPKKRNRKVRRRRTAASNDGHLGRNQYARGPVVDVGVSETPSRVLGRPRGF